MTVARPEQVPVRPAATVLLVRDTPAGIEVFMLRRHLAAVFTPGAYVFPGGAVDPADEHVDVVGVCDVPADPDAGGGLAYWVAAIRECFEEAGALLAADRTGRFVDLRDAAVAERFERHRRAVHAGERRLADICVEEGLRLSCDSMRYVSRWITPLGAPRRFDTRFFVARAPAEQAFLHDDRETIESRWVRPEVALDDFAAGGIELIAPTEHSLRTLAGFASVEDALAGWRPSEQGRPG